MMPRSARRAGSQFTRYRRVMAWLILDAGRAHGGLAVLAGLVMLASIFAEIGAIGVVIQAMALLESGEPWPSASDAWVPSKIIAAAAVTVAALLVAATGGGYASRRIKTRLRVAYQFELSERVRAALAEAPERFAVLGIASVKQAAQRGWADARGTARVLSLLIDAIVPALVLLVLVPVAVWMEPRLAAWLAVVVALASAGLWFVNVLGSRQSEAMRLAKPGASRAYVDSLARALDGERGPPEPDLRMLRHARAFEGRLIAVARGTLIGDLALAAAVVLAIYILGNRAISDGSVWSQLLTYIVVLRYTMVMFRSAVVRLTSANRFYPQAARVRKVLHAGNIQDEAIRAWRLRVHRPAVEGSDEARRLERGQTLIILGAPASDPLGELAAAMSLLGRGATPRVRFEVDGRSADWTIVNPTRAAPESSDPRDVVRVVPLHVNADAEYHPADHVAVIDASGPIGLGSHAWWQHHRAEIATAINHTPAAGSAFMDDDADEPDNE